MAIAIATSFVCALVGFSLNEGDELFPPRGTFGKMFPLSLQKVLAIQERGLQFVQFSAILFLGHYILLFDKVCCF